MSPGDPYARPDTTGSQPMGTNTPSDGSRIGTYFLGRYRVVDEIGIGGMASVHLGRMDGPGGFQKWVAIKRIHPHLIEDDSFVQMFLDEARVAARISHPNVATVFELGKHDDSYWIAMEYLHGEPLRELMRRTEEIAQTMPPEIATRIIADAAEGLHAAHELTGKNGERLNLVHRDVTPHNLFVTYDGTTKVVDFGIAKFSSRMSSTRAGTLKGKLAYMSPEQVHGEQIDRRTDIFALGVVLWELTTGQRLFRMESDLDTLAKVQECNVPRPSTLVRGYPIDLEKIVMRALAKNRGERFKTARELSRALQGLLMRRGLFIASDEVAAYVQTIFQERIQKREAHLRWAAEVTQTISLDRPNLGLAAPAESSIRSADNGRQASARPAAGARPTMQGMGAGPPSAATSAMNDPSRHAATVRPPARSDPGFDRPPAAAQSGPYPSVAEEEFDDQDATIITTAPKDINDLGRPPATARLGESGETAAMAPQVIHKGGNPFAATMDARQMQMQTQQEFHAIGQGGLGMNLMGARAPNAANSSDSLPMTQLPLHQIQNPYNNPAMNSSTSNPRILLAPLEFGSPDNRTVTARALRRGTPLWAVALGSALAAVLLLAALYLIVTHVSSPQTAPKPVASAGGTSSASAMPVASGPAIVGSGPFGGARTSFAHAIEPVVPPAPTTSATPPATPFSTAAATTAAAIDTTPAPTTAAHTTSASQPSHNGPTRVSTAAPSSDGTGLLTVVCTPSCDQVIDNGKLLGPAPIFRLKVAVGEHHLQLKNGKVTKISNAIVTAGDLKSVVIPM